MKQPDQYPDKEAQERFEKALLGAWKVGHVLKKNVTPKADAAQPKPDKKPRASV